MPTWKLDLALDANPNGSSRTHAKGFGGTPKTGQTVDDDCATDLAAQAGQRLIALGEMTGGIAHDFRNILAVVDSSLRLIENTSERADNVLMLVAGAREAIARGMKLTSQLLNLARQSNSAKVTGNANELLKDLEQFLNYGAGPNVRVVLTLAPNVPDCIIIPSQFGAAVLNLVVNARDAMPGGGEVHIGTERIESKACCPTSLMPGAYARVRVRDCGQGMSAEVLQRIFDPFFTTKGGEGSGLGLPQVCAFIQRVGGNISVSSEPDRGTTFDLLFPAVE